MKLVEEMSEASRVATLESVLSRAVTAALSDSCAVEGDDLTSVAAAVLAGREDDATPVLRRRLLALHKLVDTTTEALSRRLKKEPTSRAGFLRSLDELVGSPPANSAWDDHHQWLKLRLIAMRLRPWPEVDPKWSDDELLAWLQTTNTPDQFQAVYRQGSIDALVERGWELDMARCYAMLSAHGPALAKALRERDSSIAACIHALYDCIYLRTTLPGNEQVPMLYRHLTGSYSLSEVDSRWLSLETPDRTGFRGLCSSGITVADCDAANFGENGYLRRYHKDDSTTFHPEDSDVVGFVSCVQDDEGAHSAILTYSDKTGAFPPNTLFRLKEVKPPGGWEAPGGVFPKQRLLVPAGRVLNPGWADACARSSWHFTPIRFAEREHSRTAASRWSRRPT